MSRKYRKSIASIPKDLCEIPGEQPRRIEGPGFRQISVAWAVCPPFLGHGIAAAGLTEAGPTFCVSQRPEHGWAVMVVLAGEGQAWIDGRWRRWAADQALVLPPNCWHHYRGARDSWQLAWVAFRHDDDLPLPAAPELRPLPGAPLAAAINGCHDEHGTGHDHEAQHHWAALVDLLARRCLTPIADHRLEEVWRTVLADLGAPWTLGDLARIAGCSAESLRLSVHRATGRSPLAQLTWLRMRHAASLLTMGNDPVGAIAAVVGYENAFAFSVAFKRVLGVSPAMYRGQRQGRYLLPGDPQGRPPSRGGRGVRPFGRREPP